MLEAKNLTKRYRKVWHHGQTVEAVKNFSFLLPKGRTLGIAGNSGCGKSTVARLMMRLIAPDEGCILLNGEDVTHKSRRELQSYYRKVQMLFQHPEASLDPTKKLRQSLTEPMRVHNLFSREQRMERLQSTMKMVGLEEGLLDRFPHQISGGEAQRAILCRALTLEPEILILDEPTSMLDVSIQAHIMGLLKELQQELGLSYLFISHDLDVMRWLCDELIIMHHGEMLEQGSVERILETPQHEFTKELVSSFKTFCQD